MESKAASKKAKASSFERAFDHCPSVLLSMLRDKEAADVACALCLPQFLVRKHYAIKRAVPIQSVLSGFYPCPVTHAVFNERFNDKSTLRKLPSSVQWLDVWRKSRRGNDAPLHIGDLPRSLTHVTCHGSFDDPGSAGDEPGIDVQDWPPGLTSLCVTFLGSFGLPHPPLPPLPSTLKMLFLESDGCPVPELPRSLTSLETHNCDLPLRDLPSSLTELKWGLVTSDVTPEDIASLPASLTRLHLHGSKAVEYPALQEATLCFPDSLRHLKMERLPFRAIERLPSSLQCLFIDNSRTAFTLPDLPASLEELKFAFNTNFNEPVRHDKLQRLHLPSSFNQALHAADLPALQVLSVRSGFDQPLDDLPSTLAQLDLYGPNPYAHSLDHLPGSLQKLKLVRQYDQPLDKLPHSLRELRCENSSDQPFDALPSGLTLLDLRLSKFNRPLDRLPESLEYLGLPGPFNHPLDHLPRSLNVLHFCPSSQFNRPLTRLPDCLAVLELGQSFDQSLHLPRGLTELSFSGFDGCRFNQPLQLIRSSEPSLSTSLSCEPNANANAKEVSDCPSDSKEPAHPSQQPNTGPGSGPAALRTLSLGEFFNQPLSLPPSLTSLTMSSKGHFSQPLPASSLPERLKVLQVPRSYDKLDVDAIRARCPFVTIRGGHGGVAWQMNASAEIEPCCHDSKLESIVPTFISMEKNASFPFVLQSAGDVGVRERYVRYGLALPALMDRDMLVSESCFYVFFLPRLCLLVIVPKTKKTIT